MKAVLFSLAGLLMITQFALAQTVLKGEAHGNEKPLYAIKPINGKFLSRYHQKIESNGRFSIKIESKQPGGVCILLL